MSQKTITIISVTGHQDYAQGSAYAIMRSYIELQKKLPVENLKCVLVSPQMPEDCPDYITFVPCKPFSYLEYNYFVLYGIEQLIETDFALIVQNDGFVLNGDNWQDEFFEYDYIGAPIPILFQFTENEIIKLGKGAWQEHFNAIPSDCVEAQNGGFSLRSKKLLGALRALGIGWEVIAPNYFDHIPLEFTYAFHTHHEDIYLCIMKRQVLEEYGIKFAPTRLAMQFAVEDFGVHQTYELDPSVIFGIHTMNFFTAIGTNHVYMSKPAQCIGKDLMTNSLGMMLLTNNVEIFVPKSFFEEQSDTDFEEYENEKN
jgi:hypothetical protein